MKTPDDVRAQLAAKLKAHWHVWLTDGTDAESGAQAWPLSLTLGRPSKDTLKQSFGEFNRTAIQWRDVATADGLQLRWENRVVTGSTVIQLPTHLDVPDLDAAARVAGGEWPERLARARQRWQYLQDGFGTAATAKQLRYVDDLDDANFEMLTVAARWFKINDATGMTPRQVPVAGIHGKWLNQHHACLKALCGREDLGLVTRPSRVLFRYLDPQHLNAGRRRFDSHTLGDVAEVAYQPDVVIICENKDSALLFPDVPGAIAVFGNGDAAARQLPHVPWIATARSVLYWGDIDADGYECLNSLRVAGVPADSMLMNTTTYEAYELYGSWTDADGKPLTASPARALGELTAEEDQLYAKLVDPAWTRVRRVEQERIPLTVGRAAVLDHFSRL